MDLVATRTALHGAAELLLAGPQYDVSDTVRLRVLPDGIATRLAPDLRLVGSELIAPGGRTSLTGTFAEAAARVGLVARRLDDVYSDGPGLTPDDRVEVDPTHVSTVWAALASGDAALRAFAPEHDPILWPEHFDVAITVDEVNYGVSPGDGFHPTPYAYVGPWTPRTGAFWNQPFGAARPLTSLPDATAVAEFFAEGRDRASV